MQRNKKAKNFLPKPVYPGGNKALKQFISDTLKYPPEALTAQKEGVVRIRVEIDYKGKVVDTQILSHLGYGCDEEADRIARLMKWQINNKVRKGKVLFHKTLNIHFKIPPTPPKQEANKKKSTPSTTKITYNIVSKPKPTIAPKPKTITYTIKY